MKDKEFEKLLIDYSQEDNFEERKKIETQIWDDYGEDKAVLIIDMSGFSLLTQKHGVVHYLSMVQRMQITSEPVIENYGGSVIKFEADNCFAVFNDPLSAIRASISLNMAFDAANILTPEDLDIRISCGIDYGKILVINNNDFFGNAVNVASKLGEDTASAGEILVTKEAMHLVPDEASINHKPIKVTISGIEIDASSISYKQASA